MEHPDCSVQRLTPPGRGAVATIAVHGPGAVHVLARCFRPARRGPVAAIDPRSHCFGYWRMDESELAEEVVVGRLSTERWEVHCHGGASAVLRLIEDCRRCGAVEVIGEPPGGETLPGDLSLEETAEHLLPAALTLRAAGILLDQMGGALRTECRALVELLEGRSPDAVELTQRLDRLIEREAIGSHLVHPWRIVLCGRPNAGKSCLLNALLGYQRGLVHDRAGTTRDVLSGLTAFDGWPIELLDVPGLRESGDALEVAGVKRALATMRDADVRVLVCDRHRGSSGQDRLDAGAWRADLVVWNKSDLAPGAEYARERRPRDLDVSALTGAGLRELMDAVVGVLVPRPPGPGAAVPLDAAHLVALRSTRERLEEGNLEAAAAPLRTLLTSGRCPRRSKKRG